MVTDLVGSIDALAPSEGSKDLTSVRIDHLKAVGHDDPARVETDMVGRAETKHIDSTSGPSCGRPSGRMCAPSEMDLSPSAQSPRTPAAVTIKRLHALGYGLLRMIR